MIGSLFTGISGLQAFQQQMNVVANNIANVNTLGFKAGETIFEAMMSQTMTSASAPSATTGGADPHQVGLGVMVSSINAVFTQGGAQTTGKPTDLMIQGNGFFSLSNNGATFYTRDGAFDRDGNGNVVNPATGMMVMGFQAQGTPPAINTNAPIAPLNIPSTYASFNIGSNGMVTGISSTGATTILGQIALVSFPNPTGLQSAGNNLYTPTLNSGTPNTVTATLPNYTAATAVPANYTLQANAPSLACPAASVVPTNVTISGAINTGGVIVPPVASIKITFGTDAAGLPTTPQLVVNGVNVAGAVIAGSTITYTGGTVPSTLVVTFPTALPISQAAGSYTLNLGASGGVSGTAGNPGTNGLGSIMAGALEMSNVDLSREFSNMIIAERGFQANSKTITTSDSILTTLVNMKGQ